MPKTTKITENVSEKPKRGRPRLLEPELESLLGGIKGSGTRRTTQNFHYGIRASQVLFPDDEEKQSDTFSWICDYAGGISGDPTATHKSTILSELGRIEAPELMRAVAKHICKHRMSTKDAIAGIRKVRTQRRKPRKPWRLQVVIAQAIDNHRFRYPDTTDAQVIAALSDVMHEFGYDDEI